jgi:hypothetical protein
VEIRAMRYTGDNGAEVAAWVGEGWTKGSLSGALIIHTLEGAMTASVGDWIIRGVKGEFYPCKPDIFEATYEPVEPSV